jgi:hypothetical protein
VGSDGALWFTNNDFGTTHAPPDSIGRITTDGTITHYSDPSVNPLGIAAGPDGALWFTSETSIGQVGHANVSPSSGPPATAVTVSGGGFAAGETVNVFYKTGLPSPKKVLLCSVTSSTGTFACSGNIPNKPIAGAKGAHTIVVKGLTSLIKIKATFVRMPVS